MSALPAGLGRALVSELAGSFVQRVIAGDDLLALEMRLPGRSVMLALSVAPGAAGAAVAPSLARATDPRGGLISFRDHARSALTGLRLAAADIRGAGRILALRFEGPGSAPDPARASASTPGSDTTPGSGADPRSAAWLLLDASARPNLALVQHAESHALRRPHEREGNPQDWLALAADADPSAPAAETDRAAISVDLFARRERVLARGRLLTLLRELRAALSAARRLVSRREDDVARLGDATAQRAIADGLAAVLHRVRQGQDLVRVVRLDDGSEVDVGLDPRLPPGDNLRRQYGLAAKAERGVARASEQLAIARDRAASLETCSLRARAIADAIGADTIGTRASGTGAISDDDLRAEDVDAIASVLRECEPLLPRRPERAAVRDAARRKVELPEGIREYTSHDGLRILAGRSATSNEALTFRIARGNDAWLHARDVPGPHVVLMLPKGAEIPQESLLDAATVAHVLGTLGTEPRGEVIWTRAKDVRRVKGAGPGKVSVTHERVLPLRIEPDRVARLRLR